MTTIKKTIAGFVGFAIALSLVAVSPAQAAMTSAELASQIAALQAQLASLSGGTTTTTTSSSSYSFTRDLTIGSTGADVTALQSWLISKGFSIPAGATGYFGTQTQAAVSAYQAARGISPTAGYFGPTTRGRVASEGGSTTTTTTDGGTTTTTTTTSDLEGTDGDIQSIDLLSQYSDEEVGEGEEDVKIYGFEIEASNDGDIAIKSVKVEFDPAGNASGDSSHLDDYISGVKLWLGDEEIGSADADDFSENSSDVWTKTITVKDAVVRSDETEKFYVTVDGADSYDSGDIDTDAWTIDVTTVRFEDGSGVVLTEDLAATPVEIDFVSFGTFADTELKVSKASDTPEEGIVSVDESEVTDDVSLLKGKLKLEGDSDVNLDEFPVTFTVTGATDVDQVTTSVTLKLGDEEYTETVSTSAASATVTFDDLDFDIEAGDTVEFEVLADIEDIDGSLDEGDTITASVTSTNIDYMDVENEEGDQLTASEVSGTAIGEEQEFRSEGIQVTLVSTDTDATTGTSSNDDVGLFTIKFKVKAVGETVYVSSLSTDAVSVDWAVDKSGTATAANTQSATLVNTTDNDKTTVGNYQIEEGEEETFELSISVPLGAGGTSGQYRAVINGILWDTVDDISMSNTYSQNLDDFKTSYKVLN